MDLRVYYQKIRKIEAEIADEFPVVVSRETSDGGKPGLKSQVPRYLAARLIAEDKASLATAEQTAQFHADTTEAWREAQSEAEPVQPVRPVKASPKQGKKA
jgi:hypothetical protein